MRRIGVMFIINQIANAIWLPTFQVDTKETFAISTLVICVILFTCIQIMVISGMKDINIINRIGLRVGFSI